MFHLYNPNRDEFLSHYHKRSNVETTFSMIKAKFGDHLGQLRIHCHGQGPTALHKRKDDLDRH